MKKRGVLSASFFFFYFLNRNVLVCKHILPHASCYWIRLDVSRYYHNRPSLQKSWYYLPFRKRNLKCDRLAIRPFGLFYGSERYRRQTDRPTNYPTSPVSVCCYCYLCTSTLADSNQPTVVTGSSGFSIIADLKYYDNMSL